MTTIDQFEEILKTETDVADAIIDNLYEQQQAIIQFRDKAILEAAERGKRLLEPMESLEREREKLCRAFDSTMHPETNGTFRLSGLARSLPNDQAAKILGAGKVLKGRVERIMTVNNQNKMLLDHSLRFVRQSLRIMTDNYTKKLVDTTI
jgi:flagellar biosynthesis/type III secretory pathway chaperone